MQLGQPQGNQLNWFDSVLSSERTSLPIRVKQPVEVKSSDFIQYESSLLSIRHIIN